MLLGRDTLDLPIQPAGERQRAPEEPLGNLLDCAPHAVAIVGEDGAIRFFSSGAERLFRRMATEVVGAQISSVLRTDPDPVEGMVADLANRSCASAEALRDCRPILEAPYGHLWVERNAQGGASFRLTLPAANERLGHA